MLEVDLPEKRPPFYNKIPFYQLNRIGLGLIEVGLVALETKSERADLTPLPLFLSRVQAGFPSPADDFVEARLDLNSFLISHPAATYLLRVAGDSMTGAGIFPGDIVITDFALEPRHNDIVVAVLEGEFTVKRLWKRQGRIRLVAANPAYPPLEIREGMQLEVRGVVIHVIHSFSHQ